MNNEARQPDTTICAKAGVGDRRSQFCRIAKPLGLLCVVMVLGVGCQTSSSVHPEFRTRSKALTNLVVLPIPASAVQFKVIGAKPETFPNVEEFRQRLRREIEMQFNARGFRIVAPNLAMGRWGAITNGFDDREAWMQLQLSRAYQTLARVGGYARGNVVRPEAALLAEHEGADAVVFVSATVVTESPGAKGTRYAMNVLTVVVGLGLAVVGDSTSGLMLEDSPEGCSLELVLVDGRSGEVLWRSWVTPKSMDGPLLGKAVQEVFARYPK